MKACSYQQEILLVTKPFEQRQWCGKDVSSTGGQHLSPSEQLEEACWNGMLIDLLPEIVVESTVDKPVYLWHIRCGTSILQIKLGEFPLSIDKHFSIDCAVFLFPEQSSKLFSRAN